MEEPGGCDDMENWFCESIARYDRLHIFYLQNIPDHILQFDHFTLCVAGRNNKCENVELLKLQLPPKLTMPAEDEGRSKENDFKMLSSIYVDKLIHQMGTFREEKNIITSQTDRIGLQLYNFNYDYESGGRKERVLFVDSGWSTPNFAIDEDEKKVICSKCSHKPLVIYDLNTEKIVKELNHPLLDVSKENQNGDMCEFNNIKCQLQDGDILLVLDSSTGVIVLFDMRTGTEISRLSKTEDPQTNELWTLSDIDFITCSTYFGSLSTHGRLHLYDIRNNSTCLVKRCFTTPVNNFNILKLKMGDRGRFSISGLDSNVYVYNILRNGGELAFTHNGHSRKRGPEHLVNDHIWLPSVGENFIVSVSENRTFNCWEYNE